MDKLTFWEQTQRNRRYSWALMFLVFCFLAAATVVFAAVFAKVYGLGGAFLFLIFASIFNIGYVLATYFKSADIAIWSVGANAADESRHKVLIDVVDEMAIASGLPRPRVYVMPSADINAFAAGRDPEHSVICVTEGALAKLNRQELTSVVGHEMTHIRNLDIRFVTLVAVMVGLVSIMSQLFLRSMWYGRGGGRRSDRGGGGIMIALLLVGIVLAIVAPLIVKLVQLAISRRREFMADAGAVELTRFPPGMVSALEKIRDDYAQPREHTKVSDAVAPMFFADTTKQRLVGLFQTHPPIEEREGVLKRMGEKSKGRTESSRWRPFRT
jgi:heat shock protein HtpX